MFGYCHTICIGVKACIFEVMCEQKKIDTIMVNMKIHHSDEQRHTIFDCRSFNLLHLYMYVKQYRFYQEAGYIDH